MSKDPQTKALLESIDGQHQGLMQALERFDASSEPPGPRIDRLLSELEAYTRDHFGLEEQAMSRFRYPGQAAHVAAHEVVRTRVAAVRRRFSDQGPIPPVVDALREAVGALLQDQMISHDRALSRFLRDVE